MRSSQEGTEVLAHDDHVARLVHVPEHLRQRTHDVVTGVQVMRDRAITISDKISNGHLVAGIGHAKRESVEGLLEGSCHIGDDQA